MGELRVCRQDGGEEQVESDPHAIAALLAEAGVDYAQLELPPDELDEDAEQDEVIEACREALDALMQRFGFSSMDVFVLSAHAPEDVAAVGALGHMHDHDDAEGLLLVGGGGVCHLRLRGRDFALRCARGDFVRVPPLVRHRFELGAAPACRSVRLFGGAAAAP